MQLGRCYLELWLTTRSHITFKLVFLTAYLSHFFLFRLFSNRIYRFIARLIAVRRSSLIQFEQRKFLQQHKIRADSFSKAAATMKKQRKKKNNAQNADKEIKVNANNVFRCSLTPCSSRCANIPRQPPRL